MKKSILDQLEIVLRERRGASPDESYTARLYAGGLPLLGEKILEEAAETLEAASEADPKKMQEQLVHEAADLVYHLLALLAYKGVSLDQVQAELSRRMGVSGIEEKNSR